MRATRSLAAGLATTIMLVGTVLGTAAQSPGAGSPTPDAMSAAYVTGTLTDGEDDGTFPPTDHTEQDGIIRNRGITIAGTVTSSDPRLGGTYRYTGNNDVYPGDVTAQAGSYTLRDDLGAWIGTSTEFHDCCNDIETMQLTGEGAYAGLTANLVVDWGQPTHPFRGIIFPGAMPPSPPAP